MLWPSVADDSGEPRTPHPRKKERAYRAPTNHAAFHLHSCFTCALAQQGARANDHGCHVSCLRRSRASRSRGSSLTFGRKEAETTMIWCGENEERRGSNVRGNCAFAVRRFSVLGAGTGTFAIRSHRVFRKEDEAGRSLKRSAWHRTSRQPRFFVEVTRMSLATQTNVGWGPNQKKPNKAPEPTPGSVTPRARGIA